MQNSSDFGHFEMKILFFGFFSFFSPNFHPKSGKSENGMRILSAIRVFYAAVPITQKRSLGETALIRLKVQLSVSEPRQQHSSKTAERERLESDPVKRQVVKIKPETCASTSSSTGVPDSTPGLEVVEAVRPRLQGQHHGRHSHPQGAHNRL